ncbi:MAG: GNAT family N-acetyltransferase [Allosphingosinicella sp.]
MADKERDAMLREMAQHRGFKLVKSRRRKAGGDFGHYGLKAATSGEECLGFSNGGLTASDEDIEAFLRQQTASTWKDSLGAAAAAVPAQEKDERGKGKSAPSPSRRVARARARPAGPPKAFHKAPAKSAPQPQLRIREADIVDAEALARLLSRFAPTTADEVAERLPLLAHGGERPLVARLGDDVIGLISWHVTPVLHRPKPVGRITYLEVDEKFQRQGIGRQLVEAVEARLKKRGCGLIEVTSNRKLLRAHAFYEALGFERTSFRFGKDLEPAKKS